MILKPKKNKCLLSSHFTVVLQPHYLLHDTKDTNEMREALRFVTSGWKYVSMT
jgi:hypothetical protein